MPGKGRRRSAGDSAQPQLVLERNRYGYWEDPTTNIVFDKATGKAYGVQDHDDGEVYQLEPFHISLCERNGWDYTYPAEPDEETSDSDSYASDGSADVAPEFSNYFPARYNLDDDPDADDPDDDQYDDAYDDEYAPQEYTYGSDPYYRDDEYSDADMYSDE